MAQGVDRFLLKMNGRTVMITTLASQQPKIVGTLEHGEDDIIIIRRQNDDILVCIRKDAIATIEEVPTQNVPG